MLTPEFFCRISFCMKNTYDNYQVFWFIYPVNDKIGKHRNQCFMILSCSFRKTAGSFLNLCNFLQYCFYKLVAEFGLPFFIPSPSVGQFFTCFGKQ
jgi:hypothetical protein